MAKAKFRMVHTSFWNDPTVSEEMTPEDKYFFLYLLTNEHTTQIGIYGISKKQMAFETGYSPESINALMLRFIDHHKLIRYNGETREIAVKNWGKYNFNKGGKPVLDCVTSELKHVKDIELIPYVANSIHNEPVKKIYDTWYESLTNRGTTRGQEEEKEKEEEKEEDSQSVGPSLINQNYLVIKEKFEQTIRNTTLQDTNQIYEALEFYEPALILQAIEAGKNGRSFRYVLGILDNWRKELGINNYQDWQLKIQQKGGNGNAGNRKGNSRDSGAEYDGLSL